MRHLRFSFATLTALVAVFTGARAHAQVPTPFQLASQLDLECRSAAGQPPTDELGIRQLNPVLQGLLPNQKAKLGPLEEVCVPVAKNNRIPPQPALNFIRWMDLACYGAQADPVNVPVAVSHLNPELAHLPSEVVQLTQLKQVCLPVAKNGVFPPGPALPVARHFDIACYELAEPTSDANTNLAITQLNPVIVQMGVPNHAVRMERAHRMCVPVAKNQQPVPDLPHSLVRWIDFLKYRTTPIAGQFPPIPLELRHLNPLFQNRPAFDVVLTGAPRLMVPVAKNGILPPPGGGGG